MTTENKWKLTLKKIISPDLIIMITMFSTLAITCAINVWGWISGLIISVSSLSIILFIFLKLCQQKKENKQ